MGDILQLRQVTGPSQDTHQSFTQSGLEDPSATTTVTASASVVAYLIVDKQLNGIVPPFDEDDLIGLSWHTVGEGRPYAWAGAGLEPHAHSEGVHFREALLDASIQVVGPKREGHLEILRRFEGVVSC